MDERSPKKKHSTMASTDKTPVKRRFPASKLQHDFEEFHIATEQETQDHGNLLATKTKRKQKQSRHLHSKPTKESLPLRSSREDLDEELVIVQNQSEKLQQTGASRRKSQPLFLLEDHVGDMSVAMRRELGFRGQAEKKEMKESKQQHEHGKEVEGE